MADVEVRAAGAVLEIALNRPAKKNALTGEMYRAMAEGLRRLEEDEGLGVGLLTGAGPDFCAGNDIGEFVSPPSEGLGGASVLDWLPKVSKPLVAAVQGKAIGIGATMLLHFDVVVVATDLDLRFPFVDLGLVPEAGSTLLLPRLVGRLRAAQAMLLAAPIDAATAVSWGLATEAVPPEQLGARADQLAAALAAKPAEAVRAAKRLLRQDPASLRDHMGAELEVFGRLLRGPEFAAAARRFLDRS
jgi:enoyl-CoA hydratase/carnithine racemase